MEDKQKGKQENHNEHNDRKGLIIDEEVRRNKRLIHQGEKKGDLSDEEEQTDQKGFEKIR